MATPTSPTPNLDLALSGMVQTSVKTGASVGSFPPPPSGFGASAGMPDWMKLVLGLAALGVVAALVVRMRHG